MARLADLFVSLRADDRPVTKTIDGVRRQLNAVDKAKASPRITIPEGARADIDGLTAKLSGLSKTKVRLSVDSATVTADVNTLERQLAELRRKRTTLPVELQDKADKEINELQRDLDKAKRKQTKIPLTVERVDSQVAAVKQALGKLERDTVNIDVDVDKQGGLRGKLAGLRSRLSSAGSKGGEAYSSRLKGSILPALGRLGGAMAVAFGGAQVVHALGATIKAASDMNETVSKSDQIFGSNADQINRWAATASTSLGLSKQQALEAASSFGDMFSQIGFTGAAAARMSTATVQMSADIGSFNNLPTADVQERIAAAFRGEYDSLQKVIPNINAARVEQVALATTGKTAASALTAQEKAAAVLAIVQKDGARAAGDFARTQGGVANQSKIAKAQLSDMSAMLGSLLLPVITKVFGYLTKTALPALAGFVAGMKSGDGAGGRFAEIMGKVGSALAAVGKFLYDNRTIIGGFVAVIGTVVVGLKAWAAVQAILNIALSANPIGLVVVAIAALVAGLIYAYKHSEAFRKVVDKVGSALKTAFVVALGAVKTAIAAIVSAFISVRDTTVKVWGAVKDTVTGVWKSIVGFFAGAGAGVVGAVSGVWQKVKADTSKVLGGVVGVVSGVWSKIAGATSTALGAVVGVASGVWSKVKTVTASVLGGVLGVVTGVWNGVTKVTSTVLGAVATVLKAIFTGWLTVIKIEMIIIATVILLAWEGIKKVTSAAFTFVRDRIIAPIWGSVSSIFTRTMGVIIGAFTKFWGNIKSIALAAFTFYRDKIILPVWNKVSTIFTQTMSKITGWFTAWWNTIKSIASAAWNLVYNKIIAPIWAKVRQLFAAAQSALRAAWSAFWNTVKSIATVVFNAVRALISAVWSRIRAVFSSAQSALRAAWQSFWNTVKAVASSVWNATLSLISNVWGRIRAAFSAAQSVLRRAWSAFWSVVKAIASTVWNATLSVISSVWGRIRGAFSSAQSTVKGIWSSFWGVIKSVGASAINSVHDKITTVLGKIKNAFSTVKGNIRSIWNGLKGVVSAPINWVKDHVYNSPLVPIWNRVAGLVNGPRLKAYARGGIAEAERYANGGTPFGVRPGYTPGRDTHTIEVGGGEAIMRPEFTRGVGATFIHDANKAARTGGVAAVRALIADQTERLTGMPRREGAEYPPGGEPPGFAGGGVVGWIKRTAGGVKDTVGGALGKLKDWAIGGLRSAAGKILEPLGRAISAAMPNSGVGRTVGGIGNKAINLLLDKIKSSESKKVADDAGSGPYGGGGAAVGGGRGASRAAGLRLGASSVGTYPGHQPSMNKAWDFMINSRSVGNLIAGHMAANRKRYGISYLIWYRQMLRDYPKGSIPAGSWGPYFDGNSSNPNRAHTNHVHASYYNRGGIVPMAQGGVVKGGRGGVSAQIGERSHDELVTPLPRDWKSKGDSKMDELIAAVREKGGDAVFNFSTYNPVAEAQSVTTNKALQRVAGLGLV